MGSSPTSGTASSSGIQQCRWDSGGELADELSNGGIVRTIARDFCSPRCEDYFVWHRGVWSHHYVFASEAVDRQPLGLGDVTILNEDLATLEHR